MNEGKMFGNQGSPEQIKEAEGYMNDLEKGATKEREKNRKIWEEAGIEGEIYWEHGGRIFGNINGHSIDVSNGNPFTGTIDGQPLTKWMQAEDLYVALLPFTGCNYQEKEAADNIRKEALKEKNLISEEEIQTFFDEIVEPLSKKAKQVK